MKREELEKSAIELYAKGLSLKSVAIILGFKSPNSIKNILIKNGINRRSKAGYKKPFNENFFEKIDAEEKAYFLGYMMADGNVCERVNSSPCIRIELNNKDRYILEKFQKSLGLDDKLKYSRKNCSTLRFHSQKMFDDLAKLGVIPNKTKKESMKYIKKLESEMIRHFIRGFFDGDGWVTNTTSHGKRKGSRKCIGFCSNKIMLEEIRDYLSEILGVNENKVTERQGCAMLLFSAKEDVNKIIKYFYENANVYLKRKFDECNKIYVNTETAISK